VVLADRPAIDTITASNRLVKIPDGSSDEAEKGWNREVIRQVVRAM
jgi:hypothetical protein